MNEKLGFIGAGSMAGAIIGGVLRGGIAAPEDIFIFDIDPAKTAGFSANGCIVVEGSEEVAATCKYIVLAVKPQVLETVLKKIAPVLNENTVLISICAGISAAFIRQTVGFECRLVIVMPNTPLLLGVGASAIGRVEPIADEEFNFVKSLFVSSGQAFEIPVSMMNEVIPLNGSSPAYIYYFAKLFVDEAEKNGFDRDTANRLFCAALVGSAQMMTESGKSHDELIRMVTSPGGTTLAGLSALKENGFEHAIQAASEATIKRAYELGK